MRSKPHTAMQARSRGSRIAAERAICRSGGASRAWLRKICIQRTMRHVARNGTPDQACLAARAHNRGAMLNFAIAMRLSELTRRFGLSVLLLSSLSISLVAQEAVRTNPVQTTKSPQAPAASADPTAPAPLVLGPGDEADMTVYGVPELSLHFRVNNAGDVYLPLVGRVTIGGLSADDAQALIEKKYEEGGFLKSPHVTLAVKDYTTQGVTVLGEVAHPGTYSALSARRLFDLFLVAGGLTQRAGTKITLTHRGGGAPEEITLSSDPAAAPENNRTLVPGDTVIVSRAGIVYVVGEVSRPGGFVIDSPDGKMTTSMALAMALGPTHVASMGHAKLLRRNGTELTTTELDQKKIMQAKAPDVNLKPEDIVYVPASKGKLAADRGAGSILTLVTQLAIYRF